MGQQPSKQHHQKHRSASTPPRSQSSASASTPPSSFSKFDLSKLAVITIVFNPVKYTSRYEHYENFSRHMGASGVNLYTVECIFPSASRFDLPRQTFEVTQANNPRHIQLSAPSILWMKENMINIAVAKLPAYVEYVAWIDADIEFDRLDWPRLTMAELERYPIVQMFELSFFLGPAGKKDILRRDYSFGYSIRNNKVIDPRRYDQWYAHPGYAWAMRRSAFYEMGGLIDFCVIGSADLHFAFALLNRIEETIRPGLHSDYQALALQWAHKVADIAGNGRNVGYVPMNLYHFWHGQRNDRNYVSRWEILEKHQFSPVDDLEKHDQTGLIRLANKTYSRDPNQIARIENLERDIAAYFKSRDEDSRTKPVQPQAPPMRNKPFVAAKTQPHRSTAGVRQTTFTPTRRTNYNNPLHLWTSGPSGIHVDDSCPYPAHCSCPGHHHHHDNHHCPCSPHFIDDHHHDHHHHHTDDWQPSVDDHDHHHDHDYDHHHDHDHGHHHEHGHHENDHHHDHHHDHHGNDHSSGGGFGTHDYGGHGSFY